MCDTEDPMGRDNLQNVRKTLQEQFPVGAFTHASSKQVSDAMVAITKAKIFIQGFVRIADYHSFEHIKSG